MLLFKALKITLVSIADNKNGHRVLADDRIFDGMIA